MSYLMNLLSLLSATVSIDWLIKLCYRDGRQPAQPAALETCHAVCVS